MKSAVFIILAFCIFTKVWSQPAQCSVIDVQGEAFFNYQPLSKQAVYNASINETGDYLWFSFCTEAVNVNGTWCSNINEVPLGNQFVVLTNSLGNSTNCTVLAQAEAPTANFELLNNEEPGNGFALKYQKVNNSEVQVNLECSSGVTALDFTANMTTVNGTTWYTINLNSEYGCAYLTVSEFIHFLAKYKGVFVAIGVIFGVFCTFWGLKMFNITIFIVVAIAGTFICGSLFYDFVHYNASGGTLWVIFFICLVIGCILGYLAVTLEKIGFFALGGALGVVGGMFLWSAVLGPMLQGKGTAWFDIICGVCAVIGALLSMWLYKDIIIFSTSIVGSYMAVRAVSAVLGGFPPESELASGAASFSGWAYAYLVVMGIMAVAGIIIQFKHKKEQEDETNMDNMDNISKNLGNTQY